MTQETRSAWRATLQPTTRRSAGKTQKVRDFRASAAAVALACLFAAISMAGAAEYNPRREPEAKTAIANRLFIEVQLSQHLKISALKPGDIIEGKLSQSVYSGDRLIFPAGSPIHLTVDKLERRRKERSSYWPWVIKVFTPSHENYPTFQTASVALANGAEIPLRVSLISISHRMRVNAQTQRKESPQPVTGVTTTAQSKAENKVKQQKTADRGLTMLLQAESLTAGEMAEATGGGIASPPAPPGLVTLTAGTQARVILLRGLSASKSHSGESFRALLLEPVRLDSRVVLPQSTLFEGKVEKRTPPRWLSRPGSIRIAFTRLTLPAGGGGVMVGSLAEADLDQRSRTRMGSEGELRGGRPGAAWILINLGVAGGIAKVGDDSLQLVIEAIVSTATDASTAGVARIVAGCASGIFLVTRHGRDVVLPKYTEMNIVFNRPVRLSGWQTASEAQAHAPGRQRSSPRGE